MSMMPKIYTKPPVHISLSSSGNKLSMCICAISCIVTEYDAQNIHKTPVRISLSSSGNKLSMCIIMCNVMQLAVVFVNYMFAEYSVFTIC